MLHLLDENFSRIGSFKTYDEVVGFIHNSQIYHLVYVNNRDCPLVSPLNPIQLPVRQDLDIESLKKEWCEDYCKAHGYSLIETFNNENQSEPSTPGGSDDLVV